MQASLRTLFFDAAIAFADDEDLSIALPNIPFDPPVDSGDPNNDSENHYLKVSALPVKPSVVTVCGEARYRWLLQVDVVARDGIGELRPLRYADQLRDDVFPIHSELIGANHKFKVMTPPDPALPIENAGWYRVPVSFTVQTFN